MMWVAPAFLAAAALVGLPFILHLLRRKPKEMMRFPSLQFLGTSAVRETNKHRIRRWLALAMRCLVIGLLAAAFARPLLFSRHDGQGETVVIAIDNSMSMQAGSRWNNLKEWAAKSLGALGEGDRAGLLVMNPMPTWIVPITTDVESVRTALQAKLPGYEGTRYEPALRMAGQALANETAKSRKLVWMADGQRTGWAGANFKQPLPPGVEFRFTQPEAAPVDQAGIVRASYRREDGQITIQGAVRLAAPAVKKSSLTVEVNGIPSVRKEMNLIAGGEMEFSIPIKASREQLDQPMTVTVSLPPDQLLADNSYYLVIGGAPKLSVALDQSAAAGDFLRSAFQSMADLPNGGVDLVTAKDSLPQGRLAVVREQFFREPKNIAALDSLLQNGGTAWIWASEAPELSVWLAKAGVKMRGWKEAETGRQLRGWEPEHPMLKVFAGQSLFSVLEAAVYQGVALELPPGSETIARWSGSGDSAIAEVAVGPGRLLVTGFKAEREATDWPVKASFVPWIHATIRWLQATQVAKQQWTVGETIPVNGEGEWSAITSQRPGEPKKVQDAVLAEVPGIYAFQRTGERGLFAVNVPAIESDLAPWEDVAVLAQLDAKNAREEKVASALPADARFAEQEQRLWWWILAIVGLLLMGELTLANRTTQ